MAIERQLGRRSFLQGLTATALAAAVPTLFLATARRAYAAGFGPLVPDPKGILDLPAGFSYRILEKTGDSMDDGYRVPAFPDGMACFPGAAGTVVLMRNHEVNTADSARGPYKTGQVPPPESYDPQGMGGVSRVVVDAATFTRRSSNLVLCGSSRNCAGGPSPWGWLTCEETFEPKHGYVFLCPADADKVQMPQRIPGYGRFYHEAAAVDPATNIAYLTEDREDGCFYRFVPTDRARPFVGKLQALKIKDQDRFDLSSKGVVGQALEVEWVDVADPDPATDILRSEAQKLGAARLKRGEGIWFAAGSVYICSTSGGPVGGGQIFRYDPPAMGSGGGGRLLLLAMSTDRSKLDMPDNITVAPWGDLLMGEDGLGDQFLRGLTQSGEIYELARNAQSTSEFAGVCCSPDGRAVFANLQKDGITLVITGPFPGTNPPRPDGGVPVRDMAAGAPDLQDDEIVPEPASGCSTTGVGQGPAASTGTVGAAALALGAAAVVRRATSGTSD